MSEHPYRTANLRQVRESITSRRAAILDALETTGVLSTYRRRLLEARVRDLTRELDELDATPEGIDLAEAGLSDSDRRALGRLAKALVR